MYYWVCVSQPGETIIISTAGSPATQTERWFITMLHWALTFFAIALLAALLGFGGVAGTAAGIGKLLLQVFCVLLVIGLIFGFSRRTAV